MDTLVKLYDMLSQAFGWVLPHPISWLLGLAFGAVVFGYLVVHVNPRRRQGRISHRAHFLLAAVAVVLYVGFHSQFVHSREGKVVLGGFSYKPDVEEEVLARPNVSVTDVVSSFGGLEDPDRVWTRGSLLANRVIAALLLGFLIGSVAAYIERIPKVRRLLESLCRP